MDLITAEVLKEVGNEEATGCCVAAMLSGIRKEVAVDWQYRIIVKSSKKGDLADRNNWSDLTFDSGEAFCAYATDIEESS